MVDDQHVFFSIDFVKAIPCHALVSTDKAKTELTPLAALGDGKKMHTAISEEIRIYSEYHLRIPLSLLCLCRCVRLQKCLSSTISKKTTTTHVHAHLHPLCLGCV